MPIKKYVDMNTEELLSKVTAEYPHFSSDTADFAVFPGFCDVHVHLREPGFSYKETIQSGTEAARRGGFTDICAMPNLNPAPDDVDNIHIQRDIIEHDAVVNVHPYGCITQYRKGERLVNMNALAPFVVAFSDDGTGVQSDAMMLAAMEKAKLCDKIIAAHCEDNSLILPGGCVHAGEYARSHDIVGISSESEYKQIERDIKLAAQTGCKYHVCHISTAESVALIRDAKANGVDITCETAPHYLVLTDDNLRDSGSFKMNPPLRSSRDRDALIEGIVDGTIDMIATDHAPHSADEKSRGLKGSLFGIVGLETAFSVMYTRFVREGIISIEHLLDLMAHNPRQRFGIPECGYSLWNLSECYTIDANNFASMGRASPFDGEPMYGKWMLTEV